MVTGMDGRQERAASAFVWSPGGWFGAQLGSTLWLLILGCVLLRRDATGGALCLGGWALLNAWGGLLWSRRGRLDPYAAFQLFLGAASLVFAAVVLVLRDRGLSEHPLAGGAVSTYLPLWVIALAPALMLVFYLRERSVKRSA